MTTLRTRNGDVFEASCDLIDVTSMSRPDPRWVFTDANGHEHRWHVNGTPAAASYVLGASYAVPTLVYVVDESGIDEDGYDYEDGHNECRQCGEHIEPGTTADTTTQKIAGLRHYRINGESVSPDEFKRRAEAAGYK